MCLVNKGQIREGGANGPLGLGVVGLEILLSVEEWWSKALGKEFQLPKSTTVLWWFPGASHKCRERDDFNTNSGVC